MRSAFTIATGPESYKKMALNLARSFRRWNKIPFTIYSDDAIGLPDDLRDVHVRKIRTDQYGTGFSTKLNLDCFVTSEKCIFIDADCLVMGDLSQMFDAFLGLPVGVLGYSKTEGEAFCDVSKTCEAFGVPSIPHFNGGIYYLESSAASQQIFMEARRLEAYYDRLGLVRLRGQPNDEILVGIALAKAGVEPVKNDGEFYADFQWWPKVLKMDALSGEALMMNPPPGSVGHQSHFPANCANWPLVVHFLGHHVEGILYRREALALRFAQVPTVGRFIATIYSTPFIFFEQLQNALRPTFRKLFGTRSVKRSRSRFIVE